MNRHQKHIATFLLLKGYYLLYRPKHGGRPGYVLYHGNQNPLHWYAKKSVAFFFLDELLKVDKKDRLTLHLSNVRKLHGNNMLKKLYKKRAELKEPAGYHRARLRTVKNDKSQAALF